MKTAFTSLLFCFPLVAGVALLAKPSRLSGLDLPPALLHLALALLTTVLLLTCHWAIHRLLARPPQ